MFRKNTALLGAAFASVVASGVLLTGQQPAGGPFTAEQATAGKAAYEANCAACHGSDLMGAPPLAGEGFIGGWRTRTTRDMYGLIRTTMPADNPGGLSEPTYVNIVAYILQYNGIAAGTTPLTPTTDVRIGGPAPAAAAAAPVPRRPRCPRAWCSTASRRRTGAGRTRRGRAGRGRGTGARTRPAGTSAHRPDGQGRGEELRARDRRDAAQSRSGRLADAAARSVRVELQRAHADHARQRPGPPAPVDLADERGRNQSAVAARLQRDHLPQQHGRHRPGDRREDGRSHLGTAARRQHRDARHDALRRQAVSSR